MYTDMIFFFIYVLVYGENYQNVYLFLLLNDISLDYIYLTVYRTHINQYYKKIYSKINTYTQRV